MAFFLLLSTNAFNKSRFREHYGDLAGKNATVHVSLKLNEAVLKQRHKESLKPKPLSKALPPEIQDPFCGKC